MRPILFLLALFPFALIYFFTATGVPKTKGMKTKVIDLKPTFLHHHKHSNEFVYNFMNIPHEDVPTYNFLAMKNVSDYVIDGRSDAITVLPTLDYQAIYVFVYSGSAFVDLKMCDKGEMIEGGFATKGWNLLALDFPKLVTASQCDNFSMEHNRPKLFFEGTARFSIWKIEKFCFFKIPPTENDL